MKHIKYLSYVLRHRWFVFVECWKRGIIWRGVTHDLSKFLPDEWWPYANYFYGKTIGGTPGNDYYEMVSEYGCYEAAPWGVTLGDKFRVAWLKHIHRNPHHWQYWILHEDDGGTLHLPMPDEYRREMLCDWIGAGRALGKRSPPSDPMRETRLWYQANREKILLRPDTRAWIEDQLRAIAGEPEKGGGE